MSEPEVLVRIEGSLGHLTLNRPRNLNALNPTMIGDIHRALLEWADDPTVTTVLLDGAGDRVLCAGGDVKALHGGITGQTEAPINFFVHEYEMNAAIAGYPKPFVVFMDGLTFGGGIGVSVHASVRIVTERSQLAMPETAIGLAPDVGSLYWYSRIPGGLGTYAVLTGARLNAADAIAANLADFFVAVDKLPQLAEALRNGWAPDEAAGATPPPPSISPTDREWIDAAFTLDSLEDIAAVLASRPESAAGNALTTLRAMSPTALKVTLAAIRRAATLPTVADVLAQDLRVSSAFTRHPDMPEGIRAALIDRDRQPKWKPARWEDVSNAEVQAFFDQ